MAFSSSKNSLKTDSVLEQLLEEINFQRTKEMRQILKDDHGFVMLQGTTYWTDLFVRHFLFQNDSTMDSDDLLFFVRKKHVKGSSRYLPKFETEVDVFRKDSRKLPIGDPDIDWEETVYLNLIIHQFEYTLTLAICTRTSPKELQVLKRHSQKVYASPSRRRMDVKGEVEEITYPHICFMVDNFDEVFQDILVRDGEMVCVELVASDKTGSVQGVIFLGSIRYDALKRVYDNRQSSLSSKMAQRMTFGLFSNTNAQRCEFVRMKGPQGKGHAEMAVTKPKGSGVETPTSEPGFCATDLWDSDWEDDPEEFFVYRSQRRLSDPSANINNFVRGGWKPKTMEMDSKSRSEQEGLDTIDNGVSEIEAGDLRDGHKTTRRGSTSSALCGCFKSPKKHARKNSIVLLEMYSKQCQNPEKCAERAPLGPPENTCICQVTKDLVEESDFEIISEKDQCEFADDATSLNNAETTNITKVTSPKILYTTVKGKEELPSIEQKIDNLKEKSFDSNCNKLGQKYCTLPKIKKASMFKEPKFNKEHKFKNITPPKRITPDGTHIYYWCDLKKSELDDGAYNPLWTMRGFTQTFHFWKENKRAQSVPLNAFLTYVTLPWWSIAKDILDHREGPILTF